MAHEHHAVLPDAAVEALLPSGRRDGVFVDATFGRGGHSRRLLQALSPSARLIVFDKDAEAIQVARALQGEDSRVTVVHAGFGRLAEALAGLGVDAVDGILFDLGVSSPQLDDAQRGFSFQREGPLDMRMDTRAGPTAGQWLHEADLDELKEVIARYGEERFAFKIAEAIVARRESGALRTTRDLAELVAGAVRTREQGRHPATRSFQAIRIHINQELQELAHALAAVLGLLAPGGRLAVISFHSLEDRMVKQFIAAAARPGAAQARLPIPEKDMPLPLLRPVARLRPDAAERAHNPRARSAVMRVAERTAAPLTAPAREAVDAVLRLPPLGRAGTGRRRRR
ncbi:MAG: 16S rRNA (cytosine(1402)-N(4))-methyltransferase RsmH [Castellaniella sp.]